MGSWLSSHNIVFCMVIYKGFMVSDYKSDYEPDAEIQDSGYYGIPALLPPGQDKVPGGVSGKCNPPGNLDKIMAELEWLRARVEWLGRKGIHND